MPDVCPECDGRGTVLDAPANVLDGHPYWVPCPACHKPHTYRMGGREWTDDEVRLLPFWTICCHPSDFPEHYTVRVHWARRDGKVEREVFACLYDTLIEAEFELEGMGLTSIGRQPADDPVIVSVYI